MNNTNAMRDPLMTAMTDLTPLMVSLRQLIGEARSRVLRAVDVIQVQTCWQVGRHIVEFEQGSEARAAYGKRLLPLLAEQLTAEFGRDFDERNLRHMRAFFQTFPIWNAVRSELSWTHYRLLTIDAQERNDPASTNDGRAGWPA